MHPLLSAQLDLFGPASVRPDPGALAAAVDVGYAGFEQQLATLRQQLEHSRRQLAAAGRMASLGQIAAGVAHEINNPVAYVCSNLEMLQECVAPLLDLLQAYEDQAGGDGGDAALATLRSATDLPFLRRDLPLLLRETGDGMRRVRQIVQDLKEYSHTDEHAQQWEWADLHRGIDATLNMLRNEVKHRAEIVRDYGALPPVRCLPSQLNQVVMNLVVNAVQALGPRRGRVTLRTGARDGEVWFAVSDTGGGIAPAHLPRLFEPFFTTKPVGQGTGLGLALAQDIVHRHGGRIDVTSEPGRGSTFRVVLPLRQAP